jgi:hypothetical protein
MKGPDKSLGPPQQLGGRPGLGHTPLPRRLGVVQRGPGIRLGPPNDWDANPILLDPSRGRTHDDRGSGHKFRPRPTLRGHAPPKPNASKGTRLADGLRQNQESGNKRPGSRRTPAVHRCPTCGRACTEASSRRTGVGMPHANSRLPQVALKGARTQQCKADRHYATKTVCDINRRRRTLCREPCRTTWRHATP